MGMPCSSHMNQDVTVLTTMPRLRQTRNTTKPSSVPNRTDRTVISRVLMLPCTKSCHLSSRIKVFSMLWRTLSKKESFTALSPLLTTILVPPE